MNVSYVSAFLVPCWQLMTFYLYAGPVSLVNVFVVRHLTVFGVWLDSFSFGCLNVWVCLSSR